MRNVLIRIWEEAHPVIFLQIINDLLWRCHSEENPSQKTSFLLFLRQNCNLYTRIVLNKRVCTK